MKSTAASPFGSNVVKIRDGGVQIKAFPSGEGAELARRKGSPVRCMNSYGVAFRGCAHETFEVPARTGDIKWSTKPKTVQATRSTASRSPST